MIESCIFIWLSKFIEKVEYQLMSNIKTNKSIPVYNYNSFHLSIVTNVRTHALDPCRDNTPTMDFLSFDEIEYTNSQSDAIKSGLVRFGKDQEEEIYEALNIKDWDKILTNENIKDYLLHPNKDGLQRILDIKDEITFERVRGILVNLVNSGEYDVSNRVMNLIQLRYGEFKKNIRNTNLALKEKDATNNTNSSQEVEALKEQNNSLQEQMMQMQKMMEQMMAMQSQKIEVAEEQKTVSEPKKAGRPTTKK
jgi:hypothetical protein